MSIFGITIADVQSWIINNPDVEFDLVIGDSGNIPDATVLRVIATAEDLVLSRMPEKYRRLMKRIEDEIVVDFATEGQTSIQLGIFPVSVGTLSLYLNYPKDRAYSERNHTYRIDPNEITLDEEIGAITLSVALNEGDRVIADYEHTGATGFLLLRDCAEKIAVADIVKRFRGYRQDDTLDIFLQMESSAYQNLNRITGIDAIEDLKLLRETSGNTYARIFGRL